MLFRITKLIIDEIKFRLSNFGKLPLCNLKRERAPLIMNFCFPLCWRCTSLFIGYGIGYLFNIILKAKIFTFIAFVLFVPLIIDVLLQYFFKIESNNFRRIFTGILFGVAVAILELSI